MSEQTGIRLFVENGDRIMKETVKRKMHYLIPIVMLLCGTVGAATSGELLQQALYAEEIEGDLPAAIENYEKIISDPQSSQDHVAQALYRQGLCYLTLKNEAKASVALTRLVKDFSSQANLVNKAKPVLEKLHLFDPAALMPPDTLAYFELGNPGKQIEILLGMLKDTPFENPLAMLSQQNAYGAQSRQAQVLFNFFNPSMLAEFKKIRSYAIGFCGVTTGDLPPLVVVLHPGESDALRGLILMALSTAGVPGEPVEGMSTQLIENELGVAYDDKVIIFASPKERLPWCIKQYKGVSTEPSLASSNPSFAKLDKVERSQDAATVWVNVDDLYAQTSQLPHSSERLRKVNSVLNLPSIEDLAIKFAIKPDGLNLNGAVCFKKGIPNMNYELVRTPKTGSAALKAVPPEAFFFMNFALSGEPDSLQAAQLRTLIQAKMGVDIEPHTLEGIEQVVGFFMPLEPGVTVSSGIPSRAGIVIACKNPGQVGQALESMIAAGPGQGIIIKQMPDGIILLSDEQSVVDASESAFLRRDASALDAGPLCGHIESILPEANKMVLMNGAGLVRLIGQRIQAEEFGEDSNRELAADFERLAEQLAGTMLAAWTDEQSQTLTLEASLTGIPPLSRVLAPLTEVQKSMVEIKQQRAEEQAREWNAKLDALLNLPPAQIAEAPTAPVIDGEVDEAWNAAVEYELTKTIYVNPGPEEQLSASYRMLWDAEKLYVLIDVTDSSSGYNPDQIWQFNDGIELYLDATDSKSAGYGDTDYMFGLLWRENDAEALCIQERGRPVRAIETAMTNTEKGYRFEVSFPWSELGTTAAVGARIGVEVQVNDNRGRGGRDAKISWHDPYDQAWLNPQYFGRAVLVGQSGKIGQVGYWPCDEMAGATVGDQSGLGHGGTWQGNVKWAQGRIGGALDLDGKGSYVTIPHDQAFLLSTNGTIACWVNIRSVTTDWMPLITKGNTSWRLSTDNNRQARFHLGLDNQPSGARIATEQPVGLGEWHHVTATFGDHTMQLYVDGQLSVTGNSRFGSSFNNCPVMIGGNAEAIDRCFDGLIDEVRVYNYVLSADEIRKLASVEDQ